MNRNILGQGLELVGDFELARAAFESDRLMETDGIWPEAGVPRKPRLHLLRRAAQERFVDSGGEIADFSFAGLKPREIKSGLKKMIDTALTGPGVVLELLVQVGLFERDQ